MKELSSIELKDVIETLRETVAALGATQECLRKINPNIGVLGTDIRAILQSAEVRLDRMYKVLEPARRAWLERGQAEAYITALEASWPWAIYMHGNPEEVYVGERSCPRLYPSRETAQADFARLAERYSWPRGDFYVAKWTGYRGLPLTPEETNKIMPEETSCGAEASSV